ncbi:MAG: hypothetical protein KatS3mg076_2392 [Candidatus Binatia bacterium]|nr:MAG: hypothetical protein KatS3mg076_2392 [Candidatus Binatia bacterium]
MVKLVFCLRRKGDLSREEFQRYWLEKHGPLVRRHAAALKIRRYVQSHTLDTPFDALLRESRGTAEGYDGVAEVWWESLGDLEAALGSAEGRAAGLELLEDEKRFIDLPRSAVWFVEEKFEFSSPTPRGNRTGRGAA